jgi:hypothetical protein
MNMALVVQPTTMALSDDLGKAESSQSDESLLLLLEGNTSTSRSTGPTGMHEYEPCKKRAAAMESTHQDDDDKVASPLKKKRRLLSSPVPRVQFVPDPTDRSRVHTSTREFDVDYDKAELWWTTDESQALMQRQTSLLQFYANTCQDLVDSVVLVWVNCAEEVMDDGNFCMTPQQRAQVAELVAQSPIRGFEKEYGAELIIEQRMKTIGGLLELQQLCHLNNVTCEDRVDAMAEASRAFSQTASLFALTIAQADAKGALEYCRQGMVPA